MRKLKRDGIVVFSTEVEKKVKFKSFYYVEIIGWLEYYLEFLISKIGKFCSEDLARTENDRNAIVLLSADGPRSQDAVEGDTNDFFLACQLLIIGC